MVNATMSLQSRVLFNPKISLIVPHNNPTQESPLEAYRRERYFELSHYFYWIIRCSGKDRRGPGSVILVAPQGFEPFEMEQDMTNLVEDAHMDAHTSKKYLMLDFFLPSIALSEPLSHRMSQQPSM